MLLAYSIVSARARPDAVYKLIVVMSYTKIAACTYCFGQTTKTSSTLLQKLSVQLGKACDACQELL